MKKLFTIVICLIGLNMFAQQSIEIAPNSNINTEASMATDTLNFQFTFPCAAFVGEYGVETDGTNIYVSQWLGDLFAKYDQAGNVIDTFTIAGLGQNIERVRDMAYDGQYYYGSPNDFYFYVLDLDNKVVIDTIFTSFRIRGMAYDPFEDVLWATENWLPRFYKMNKQGNILESWDAAGVTMNSISGLAVDNSTYGGPFLWGFSQDSTGAMIIKYDIATQSQTGSMIDMAGLGNSNSIAGGLFIHQMGSRSEATLGGMIQNDIIFAFDLDYANMLVTDINSHDMITSMEIYPNPVTDIINIKIEVNNQANLQYRIINQQGQVIHFQEVKVNELLIFSVETDNLTTGIYFVQINNNKGYTFTKKFVVTK
ncbi:MAG: T9SS type A sorting domain-containing protein [Bacteroidota bacterium]